MASVKAANPRIIFAPDDWAAITAVSNWRGIWLIVHAWLMAAMAAFGAAWAWQFHWAVGLAATPFALAIIGGRQLGLSILMHDGAHGHLHPNRKWNNWLGQWPSGAATGSDLHAYRTYHLTHHRYTQQDEDPDLALSKPFPTSRDSLRRKVIRDLTGQTFFKQRSAQARAAWRGVQSGASEAAKTSARTFGRFLLVQFLVLAVSLAFWGWTPFLLWVAALATTFQLALRIRNIAEHACTTTGSDDPFTHARTTLASWWERATVAPYWVNYHSEHHLFMGVPCYHLPRAHALLGAGGYHHRMTIEQGYAAVIRRVTASPLS
jgi:fatty acid desaturase